MSDSPKVIREGGPNGGNSLTVKSGGTISVEAGGALTSAGTQTVAAAGRILMVAGAQLHSSTATVAPTRPGALGATATLSDGNLAANSVAINTIAAALVLAGILTATS